MSEKLCTLRTRGGNNVGTVTITDTFSITDWNAETYSASNKYITYNIENCKEASITASISNTTSSTIQGYNGSSWTNISTLTSTSTTYTIDTSIYTQVRINHPCPLNKANIKLDGSITRVYEI